MSGPSKQPHNAGQTVIVQQISPMPVSDMDWGPITITENWGRLFICWEGQEIIAVMGHYPKLAEAIQHFIGPEVRTPDPAQIRADALLEALAIAQEAVAKRTKQIEDERRKPTQRIDVTQTMRWGAGKMQAELIADEIAALIATPLSPTAVDGSIAPDAGGKEGV